VGSAFPLSLFATGNSETTFAHCSRLYTMCRRRRRGRPVESIGSARDQDERSSPCRTLRRAFRIGTSSGKTIPECYDPAARFQAWACVIVFNLARERGLERFTSPQLPAEMVDTELDAGSLDYTGKESAATCLFACQGADDRPSWPLMQKSPLAEGGPASRP